MKMSQDIMDLLTISATKWNAIDDNWRFKNFFVSQSSFFYMRKFWKDRVYVKAISVPHGA